MTYLLVGIVIFLFGFLSGAMTEDFLTRQSFKNKE